MLKFALFRTHVFLRHVSAALHCSDQCEVVEVKGRLHCVGTPCVQITKPFLKNCCGGLW